MNSCDFSDKMLKVKCNYNNQQWTDNLFVQCKGKAGCLICQELADVQEVHPAQNKYDSLSRQVAQAEKIRKFKVCQMQSRKLTLSPTESAMPTGQLLKGTACKEQRAFH